MFLKQWLCHFNETGVYSHTNTFLGVQNWKCNSLLGYRSKVKKGSRIIVGSGVTDPAEPKPPKSLWSRLFGGHR